MYLSYIFTLHSDLKYFMMLLLLNKCVLFEVFSKAKADVLLIISNNHFQHFVFVSSPDNNFNVKWLFHWTRCWSHN